MAVEHLMQIAVAGYRPMPKELTGWSGVAENAKCHLDITPGPTIQRLEFVTNYTDAKKIKKVILELNSREIVNLTGAELKQLNAYRKQHAEAGRFIIDFAGMEYRTKAGIRTGELVTLPTDTLTLYVEFGDNGGTAPTIRGRMLVTPAQARRVIVPRLYTYNFDAVVEGDNDWRYKQGSMHRFIRRMHMQSADIRRLEVKRDDLILYEANTNDNTFDLLRYGMAPQAGVYTFDPTAPGFGLEGLFPTVANRELIFRMKMAKAGAVPVLMEEIEQVEKLVA